MLDSRRHSEKSSQRRAEITVVCHPWVTLGAKGGGCPGEALRTHGGVTSESDALEMGRLGHPCLHPDDGAWPLALTFPHLHSAPALLMEMHLLRESMG
jgi:hypothetical protein